ncbi:MAG: TIGR01906 family membrane protein [Chloroflexota bacterium]
MRLLRMVAIALVVGVLPFLLAFLNVRWMALDRDFYLGGFAAQGVALTTGMSEPQLGVVADQIVAYFGGGGPVSLVVDKEWGTEPLFSPKESGHMVDVRDLVWRVFDYQTALSLAFAIGVALTLVERSSGRLMRLARRLLGGAAFALLLLLGLLVAAILDFPSLFLSFHLLSFTNLDWILDPRTDYLIRLFPYGFWYNAGVSLVLRTLVAATLVLLVSACYLRLFARGTRG